MAIDILSRLGSSPIVVGDESDMRQVRGLVGEEDGGRFLLQLVDGTNHRIRLSPKADEQMLASVDWIAVALNSDDTIAWAFVCSLDDSTLNFEGGKDSKCGRRLNDTELKELAEDLVAGDFNLDFLRGSEEAVAESKDPTQATVDSQPALLSSNRSEPT